MLLQCTELLSVAVAVTRDILHVLSIIFSHKGSHFCRLQERRRKGSPVTIRLYFGRVLYLGTYRPLRDPLEEL